MENSDMIDKIVKEAWDWIVSTYQTEGLDGLLITILVGGLIFGGMGFIYWAAAGANARGMKRDDKKDS